MVAIGIAVWLASQQSAVAVAEHPPPRSYQLISRLGGKDATLSLAAAWLLACTPDSRSALSRTQHSVISSAAVTLLLKRSACEQRPTPGLDGRFRYDSFPSGHTSQAFAMAASLGEQFPKFSRPAYAVAALVGYARVRVRAHRPEEVVVGAMIGLASARRTAERSYFLPLWAKRF
jgi:membrane-associated phospholipid phosphatase